MALEESSILEIELGRRGQPGMSKASGSKKKKPRKATEELPAEGELGNGGRKEPPRREAEIEGLTAAGHQALERGHRKAALSCFKKAFALSSETPGCAAQRVCALNLGAAYVEAGRPEKGLPLLLASRPGGGEAGEPLGDLFFNIGAAHEGLGDFGEALEAFRTAQGHYRSVRVEGEAGTWMKMGDCHLGLGDLSGASRCFWEAGRAFAGAESLEAAALALSRAARLMLQSQEHQDSEVAKVLTECRQLCERIPNRALLGKLYNDIGLGFSRLKIFSLAVENFERALPFCQAEAGEEAANVLQNLGVAHNALGRFSTAVGFHQRAAAMHGLRGNRRAQGHCFGNLAYALSQLGDHDAARENYLHGLQAFKDAGDVQGQWRACEGLGASHVHLGDPQKAVASYKEALTLISKCQDSSEMAQERIVTQLAGALQSSLPGPCCLSRGGGIPPAAPTHHLPISCAASPVRFATPWLHRKKADFPAPACRVSEPSAGQRCHQAQAPQSAPATGTLGPLQWGRAVATQDNGLKPKPAGHGVSAQGAACANEASALGILNGHAILVSGGADEDPQQAATFPDQTRGDRAPPPVGRLPHRHSVASQQGWWGRFNSTVCALM